MTKPQSKTRQPKDVAPGPAHFGARNDAVRELQTFLRDYGYQIPDDSGSFENYTRNAVAMFREANGLGLSGDWDEAASVATGDLLAQGSVVAFTE